MTKEQKNEVDQIADAVRRELESDGMFQTFDTDNYIGCGIMWNRKPYILTILEAKVVEG